MKTLQKLALIVFTAISLSGIAASQATTLEAQRAVVVKLHTHFSTQKKDETAAGLYVGKDQQYAYFITARHALADEVDDQEVHAQSAELWFYGSPQSLKTLVFERTDAILDLGVVYLPITDLPPNLPRIVRRDAAVNVAVRIIGHPAAGDWSAWEGNVQNDIAPNGDVRHFTTTSNPSLAHGYSGGALFDPDGNFLGMHRETTASYGRAVKSVEIIVQLKAWHVPTDNVSDESDADAIKNLLVHYADAYNHLDANALWRVWPSASANVRRAIENSFENAVSIEMHLQMQDPKQGKDGASASVRGRFSQIYVPRQGNQPPRKDGDITFVLKKNSGVWTINDVR